MRPKEFVKEWIPTLKILMARQPRFALIAAAGLLGVAGWVLYMPPAADLQRLGREWRVLKSAREEERLLSDRFYREKVGLIPDRNELSKILEALHEKARQHQVEILSVSPGAIPSPGKWEPAFCPVELQLEGEYRALGKFLGELQDPSHRGWISIRRLQIGREEGILPRLRAQVSMEIALQ